MLMRTHWAVQEPAPAEQARDEEAEKAATAAAATAMAALFAAAQNGEASNLQPWLGGDDHAVPAAASAEPMGADSPGTGDMANGERPDAFRDLAGDLGAEPACSELDLDPVDQRCKRLKLEAEQLGAENKGLRSANEELRAENAELRAENDVLRLQVWGPARAPVGQGLPAVIRAHEVGRLVKAMLGWRLRSLFG